MRTQEQIAAWIKELIQEDRLWKFYKSIEWRSVKSEVLQSNHYECAICKQRGKITRYDVDQDGKKKLISTVHHNQFVRNHPELAISKYYYYEGKRYINLIPVCKACHNQLHPEKNKSKKKESFVNKELW